MIYSSEKNDCQLALFCPQEKQLAELIRELTEKSRKSEEVFKVKQVIWKDLANGGKNPFYPFKRGTVVKQSRGKNYGVVESIQEESTTPITIAWWKQGQENIPWWDKRFRGRKKEVVAEKISYPLDYMKPLGISPIEEFIPHRTFLKIKAGTSVILESGEIVQLGNNDVFFLSKLEEDCYYLVRPGEEWIFPSQLPPGEPIGYIIEPPTIRQLEAARYTSRIEIGMLAKLFLSEIKLEQVQLLEKIKLGENPGNDLKAAFRATASARRDMKSEDFDAAWEKAYEELLFIAKRSVGIWNYRIGDRMVYWEGYPAYIKGKYQIQYKYVHGFIKDLDITPSQPTLIIEWESGEENAYRIEKLHENQISKIQLIKVSSHVSYEVSDDGKYYKSSIGFRTKKLARSWWRKLKKELGWIGDPIEASPDYNPTNLKYYCIASKPKQKTLKGRLKHLGVVSQWNLDELGSKPNHL